MKSLKDIPVGETGVVVKILGEGALRRRLLDMGITKGVSILVRKLAPLGDPMQIHVRGYELSLRQAEAERIVVE
ncbi:MAG: ferrous iron transport protein A [Phascolarctobacterium sp.]|nr:ferrous iron transport protein A [Phascolarctobacterium sp.]